MENKAKFAETMASTWAIYYPDKELPHITVKGYWEVLNKYTEEAFSKAIVQHIQRGKFFPKPADLIELIEGTDSQNAGSVWASLIAFAEKGTGERPKLDAKTDRAVSAIGGWTTISHCPYAQLQWVEKRFKEAYDSASSEERREALSLGFEPKRIEA